MLELKSSNPQEKLPVELESELELTRVESRGRLPGKASTAGGWIADLVHRSDVGVVGQVEDIGDEIDTEALPEIDAFRDAQVGLGKARCIKAVAPERSEAAEA